MPIIKTYVCNDDKRVINKTLTDEAVYNCEFLDKVDMITPAMRLYCSATTFTNNYVYIPTFDKYYFVVNSSVDSARTIILQLQLDVLKTYENKLLNSDFLIVRNENIKSNYIEDSKLPILPYQHMKVIEFSENDFNIDTATENNYNFLLNVAGGGSNQQ